MKVPLSRHHVAIAAVFGFIIPLRAVVRKVSRTYLPSIVGKGEAMTTPAVAVHVEACTERLSRLVVFFPVT